MNFGSTKDLEHDEKYGSVHEFFAPGTVCHSDKLDVTAKVRAFGWPYELWSIAAMYALKN